MVRVLKAFHEDSIRFSLLKWAKDRDSFSCGF